MLSEEADNGEEKEADPDALEHTDDRNTGKHKETTEAGKANAHQMEDEQFEEGSEAGSIEELAHPIVRDTDVVPAVDQIELQPAHQQSEARQGTNSSHN